MICYGNINFKIFHKFDSEIPVFSKAPDFNRDESGVYALGLSRLLQ